MWIVLPGFQSQTSWLLLKGNFMHFISLCIALYYYIANALHYKIIALQNHCITKSLHRKIIALQMQWLE